MLTTSDTLEKSVTINIRAGERQRSLIDRAARLTGKSRSEFMLASATAAAEDAILDQRVFLLDGDRFKRFLEMLDAPVGPNPRLKALLVKKSPWEA